MIIAYNTFLVFINIYNFIYIYNPIDYKRL
jgi:hypothetical protein